MDAKAIIDPKTLERWLTARPGVRRRADAIAIAQRAAARVFPVWAAAMPVLTVVAARRPAARQG